ncbi:hypothetical protein [Sphingobacterium lactis]|uniref:Uncharacterized protein n=1 Tax=Sphingobacterium lactis TaxID=797291 RepID=A0A1H5YIW2_9SPHI|nr:hypothetical protein [Sphingobacterium lactis]SEG23934.1 hypothetical protein SAMN05421877_10618 [Sphingobacterium lactis]
MKPKTIVVAILLAFLVIVLFNNKEEASFWLFGEIRTSKLLILGTFFLLGVIVGAVLFRRKAKHPKEYGVTNPNLPERTADSEYLGQHDNDLSDDDREYIRRD